jgi:hypothetical protein
MAKKLTTEEFINRARAVHGDKYGYDEVVYVNARTKVSILCDEHGRFEQLPNSHLNGQGCKLCHFTCLTSCTDSFIKKAESLFGTTYIYDDVVYVNNNTSVIIKCRVHGKFKQLPRVHLSGHGCVKCAHAENSMSSEEFINKASYLHGEKYTYEKTNYKGSHNKIAITCKKHGDFIQTPSNHLYGLTGCPKCATVISKGHAEVGAFLESILNG